MALHPAIRLSIIGLMHHSLVVGHHSFLFDLRFYPRVGITLQVSLAYQRVSIVLEFNDVQLTRRSPIQIELYGAFPLCLLDNIILVSMHAKSLICIRGQLFSQSILSLIGISGASRVFLSKSELIGR